LVCLFLWVGEERWTGDLSGLSDDDLEEEADWDGERGALVAALIEVGFIDGSPMARSIHDWAEHNPYASGKGQRIEKAKEAANARWSKHATSMPLASSSIAHEQCPPTPTPTPTPTAPKEKTTRTPSAHTMLSGVPSGLVDDFMEIRKKKRAALTQTAVDGIIREAAKAGYSLEEAIRTCCERGWQGFKAEWVADTKNRDTNHAKPKLTPAERTAVNIALNNGGEIPSGYENNRDVVSEVERNLRTQVGVGLRNGRDLLGSADVGEGIKWLNGGTGR
jgi:hypothetical protein